MGAENGAQLTATTSIEGLPSPERDGRHECVATLMHTRDIRIRPMTLADVAAAMSLKNTAGWNQTETDWSWLLRWSPNGCFAACDQDALVGTVSTIAYNRRVAWIGVVIVKSKYRKMGCPPQILRIALKTKDCFTRVGRVAVKPICVAGCDD
jgi:RimJ/RimL family protein N-acetyltransferase